MIRCGRPAIPGMPGMAGSHENWGNFKCHKWGELLRHSQSVAAVEQQRIEYTGIFGKEAADALIDQEFYCSFEAAILGAYWGKEVLLAEQQGRICDVPVNTDLPVHTAWDIGIDDAMAIWCFQVYPDHIDVVDYHEGHGQGFDSYCGWLDARGYHGTDWFPHDVKVREAGAPGARTRFETLVLLGRKPALVPNETLMDGGSCGSYRNVDIEGQPMVRKEQTSTATAGTSACAGQGSPTGNASWPSVEEGHRLIRAFCDIKQATVREAIIRSVEEISTLASRSQHSNFISRQMARLCQCPNLGNIDSEQNETAVSCKAAQRATVVKPAQRGVSPEGSRHRPCRLYPPRRLNPSRQKPSYPRPNFFPKPQIIWETGLFGAGRMSGR